MRKLTKLTSRSTQIRLASALASLCRLRYYLGDRVVKSMVRHVYRSHGICVFTSFATAVDESGLHETYARADDHARQKGIASAI